MSTSSDPAILVAVLLAARRAGDRRLEAIARDELRSRFGLRVSFIQKKDETQTQGDVNDDTD